MASGRFTNDAMSTLQTADRADVTPDAEWAQSSNGAWFVFAPIATSSGDAASMRGAIDWQLVDEVAAGGRTSVPLREVQIFALPSAPNISVIELGTAARPLRPCARRSHDGVSCRYAARSWTPRATPRCPSRSGSKRARAWRRC